MNRKNNRRKYNPQEKFETVKQVITKAKTVSEVCTERGIHVNQYYRWQKDFFEGAFERFLEGKSGRKSTREQREKEKAEEEIRRLNEVITAVVKENVDLKKKNLV